MRDFFRDLDPVMYEEGPSCPYCASKKFFYPMGNRRKCQSCERSFSYTTKTIFHGSKLDIKLWFCLIALINDDKKISNRHVARLLNISQNTAWGACKKIRENWDTQRGLFQRIIKYSEKNGLVTKTLKERSSKLEPIDL